MNIKPFRAYRYNNSTVDNAGDCIAPPYDVIDPDQQEKLYNQSPYNIARVIKGKSCDSDSDDNNVYTRAGGFISQWIQENVLKQDDADTIYVYAQDFQIDGTTFRRSGFIALGELQEYGGNIKPHEQTLAGPKADRLNLMRATGCQIGQIFMLYSDADKTVDAILAAATEGEKLLSFVDDDNVTHSLFAVTDPAQIATVQEVMSDKHVFIADGHHRYETSLNYMRETEMDSTKYRMMTFINTHNEGLVVLPTHRLVHSVDNFDTAKLLADMSENFDIARLAFADDIDKKERFKMMNEAMALDFQANNHAFGMYFADGAFYVATMKDEAVMDSQCPQMGSAWRKLDVAILHKLILEDYLGIDEAALTAQTNVKYIKDFGVATLNAIEKVDTGKAQALFFMNTTRADEVAEVAAQGDKMPQKSTFFHPKIYSGLTINAVNLK
ncbi:MAG: DUF1015 domain-containing protein [Phycisphaerae bacterium]|nr:DUF1015 domain-containing protein [Phycisphaerae bacterium]